MANVGPAVDHDRLEANSWASRRVSARHLDRADDHEPRLDRKCLHEVRPPVDLDDPRRAAQERVAGRGDELLRRCRRRPCAVQAVRRSL